MDNFIFSFVDANKIKSSKSTNKPDFYFQLLMSDYKKDRWLFLFILKK